MVDEASSGIEASDTLRKVLPVKLVRGKVHEFCAMPQNFDTDSAMEEKVENAKVDFSKVKSTLEEFILQSAKAGESAPNTAPVKASGGSSAELQPLVFLENFLLIKDSGRELFDDRLEITTSGLP